MCLHELKLFLVTSPMSVNFFKIVRHIFSWRMLTMWFSNGISSFILSSTDIDKEAILAMIINQCVCLKNIYNFFGCIIDILYSGFAMQKAVIPTCDFSLLWVQGVGKTTHPVCTGPCFVNMHASSGVIEWKKHPHPNHEKKKSLPNHQKKTHSI